MPLDEGAVAALPPSVSLLYLECGAASVLPRSLAQATGLQVLQLQRGGLSVQLAASGAHRDSRCSVLTHRHCFRVSAAPSDPHASLVRLTNLRELSLEQIDIGALAKLLDSVKYLTALEALFIQRCSGAADSEQAGRPGIAAARDKLDGALAHLPRLKILSMDKLVEQQPPPSLLQVGGAALAMLLT